MKVKSYSVKDVSVFKTLLEKELQEGFSPKLAICFSDANVDFESLTYFLASKDIDTIGTTTCGEIFDDTSLENSCSILLFDIDRESYHIELINFSEGEDVAAKKIAKIALQKFSEPALITYASKLGTNGDKLVRGFKKVLKPSTPIFGGLSGDNFKNEKFTVFHNGAFETEGLVTLILDGNKIKVQGEAFSGWEALGMTYTATKVDGNVLYELDGKPALDLFIEYFGLEKANVSKGEKLEMIPGVFPLEIIGDNDEVYLRSPLFYDKEHQALILAGEVNQGNKIKFCPMPDIDTVTKTVDFFKDYSSKIDNADAIIINSCAARKLAFGPLMNKEIKEIFKIWQAPTAGLMAMGEIGNHASDGEFNFHNVTCSLVSLTAVN